LNPSPSTYPSRNAVIRHSRSYFISRLRRSHKMALVAPVEFLICYLPFLASAVWHVGCESEQTLLSTRAELRRANRNKDQTFRPRNLDHCPLTLVAGQVPNTVQRRSHCLQDFDHARAELSD